MMKGFFWRALVGAFLVALVWGCVNLGEGTKQKTKFYILHSLSNPAQDARAAGHSDGLKIGVGPVQFPEYLARPQIITRLGPSQVTINEFYRWAEPLDESFLRVLGENLSIILSTNHVFVHPWKASTAMDYNVTVEVTRFDGILGREVLLSAVWAVYDDDGKKLLLRKKRDYIQVVDGDGYEALVTAHRQSLETLSHDIGGAIQEMAEKKS